MRYKTISLIAALLWWNCPLCAADLPALHVHLARAVRVSGTGLRLGGLGAVRGADAALVSKASDIAMGRSPWPGERIVIDRRTILSRLATSGISGQAVRLTGAREIAVTRGGTVFEADLLVVLAQTFLKKNPPDAEGCHWRLLRKPKDLLVPEAENIQLKPRLGSNPAGGDVRVQIAATSGEREIGVATVLFGRLYPVRRLVATRNIPAGGVVTRQNAKITIVSASRKGPEWTSPYGKTCVQAIRTGDVIRPGILRALRPAVIVRRNRIVEMKIQGVGFIIVAKGQALQDGRPGELIKVRNIDSRRIVNARVAFDGTVSPVYGTR